MSNVTVPYSNIGQASFEKLDNYLQSFLLAGSEPELFSYPFTVAANTTIAQFQVVGLNSSGQIIPAVSGTTQAIGVATQAITTASGDTSKSIPVFISGHFNTGALVYDSSYDSVAKKEKAFFGATAPTQILCKTRPTGAPNT